MTEHTTAPINSWAAYHRRAAALTTVIEELDRTGATSPSWTAGLAEVFTGPDDLLVALHDRWTRRLQARIDNAAELASDDVAESVADAWRELAAELPGVRRVLDAHADHPALRRHELHEHRMVAVAAELAAFSDPVSWAAARGAKFVTELRVVPTPGAAGSPGFLERLRAVLPSIA